MKHQRPHIVHQFFNSNKYLPECDTRLSVWWSLYNVRIVYALIMICCFPWKLQHKPLDSLEFTFINRWFHRYVATWPAPWTLNMEHVKQYENEFWCIFFSIAMCALGVQNILCYEENAQRQSLSVTAMSTSAYFIFCRNQHFLFAIC